MMGNIFLKDEQARDAIAKGWDRVYEPVSSTMGPKGRNVIIKRKDVPPIVTHDGVTVARHIQPTKEEIANGVAVGIDLGKRAADKMDIVGDGTTTVTVIGRNAFHAANKLIVAGHNPMDFKAGILDISRQVAECIKRDAVPITGKKKLAEIATISAGEEEMGTLIADVIHKVGENSVVTVDKSSKTELTSEIVKGFSFDRGYISPWFMNDTKLLEATYTKPLIFLTDKKLTTVNDIVPIVEAAAKGQQRPLLIVAQDVESEALAAFIKNKQDGTFPSVCVKTPYGEDSAEVLEDLAILTGAKVYLKDAGDETEGIEYSHFGQADKVVVGREKTTIINGKGKRSDVRQRIKDLEEQDEAVRIARLQGKVAVITVGDNTPEATGERADRVIDAVSAAKAALAEGILPGGGTYLMSIADSLEGDTVGHQVMREAIKSPYRTLMRNSGLEPGVYERDVVKSFDHGVDVKNPTGIIKMIPNGIIDPAKVTRQAVENAATAASTAITGGGLVIDQPEDKDGSN